MLLWNVYSREPAQNLTVVTPRKPGDREFDRQHAHESIRISANPSVPVFRVASYAWSTYRAVREVAHRSTSPVLHCGHIHAALAAPRLKAKYGVPYVVWGYALELTGKWIEGPIRRSLIRADKVFSISNYTTGLMESLGVPSNRIVKILPGADPIRFSPNVDGQAFLRDLGLAGKRIILTLGKLTSAQRYKGQDMVIRSLPSLRKTVPNLVYLIAGKGPDTRYLLDLAQQCGVADQVRILGEVSDADLPRLYASCDVFALCSRAEPQGHRIMSEGFGMVLIEANATGKPVIGGKSGGVPDAVRDGITGFLVDPCSPEAIGTALHQLLTQPELARRMGDAGRKWVVDEMNWDRIRRDLDAAILASFPQ